MAPKGGPGEQVPPLFWGWPWGHVPRAHTATVPQLLVWNHSSLSPVQQYTEHLAAVKAIAWSPHQHGLLASGGGTADRCIRFWNTLTGQPLQCVDTGSQVCNLAWSKHANELVSGRPPGRRAGRGHGLDVTSPRQASRVTSQRGRLARRPRGCLCGERVEKEAWRPLGTLTHACPSFHGWRRVCGGHRDRGCSALGWGSCGTPATDC